MHNVHRFDFVMQRLGPLSIANLEEYDMALTDTLMFEGQPLAVLEFRGKKFEGKLFINLNNFSFQRGEFAYRKAFLEGHNLFRDSERLFLAFQTEYGEFEGRYRLRQLNYRTAFSKKERGELRHFYLVNTFSIHRAEASTEPIRLADRVAFQDILLEKLPITAPEQQAEQTAAQSERLRQQKKLKRLKWLTRMAFSFSLDMLPLTTRAYSYQLGAPISQDYTASQSETLVPIFNQQIEYRLTNGFYARVGFINGLSRSDYSATSLGLLLARPVGQTGKWNYLVGTDFGFQSVRNLLDNDLATEDFTLDGQRFNSGRLRLFAEERSLMLMPSLGLEHRLGNQLYLRMSAFALLTSVRETGFYLVEKDEVWWWNLATTFSEGTIFGAEAGRGLFTANYGFSLGVVLK